MIVIINSEWKLQQLLQKGISYDAEKEMFITLKRTILKDNIVPPKKDVRWPFEDF